MNLLSLIQYFCFATLLLISVPAPVYSNALADFQESVVQQSRELRLSAKPAWLAMMHYKKEVFSSRFSSQADDERFFLAEQGRSNMAAELEADLRAMLLESMPDHAQCRFPARWHWLKQQLSISDDYDVSCPELEAWLARLQTKRLSLVFPSMYLGNPGSAFGHTFLRFDAVDSPLLSYALNYAAISNPDDNPLAYIYNGVFGGYTGVFAIRRYFETVQIYSDIENRDIWEYQLAYTPSQIVQLARHVWELTDIKFDYFFLNENCSFRLLAMLDVVTPDAPLSRTENFPLYAIPVDTVRALDHNDLITRRYYRPSLATKLTAGFEELDEGERERVVQLVESTQPPAEVLSGIESQSQQANLLQQAYSLLQFRQLDSSLRADQLLKARSQLGTDTADDRVVPVAPEQGHASARLAIKVGRQDGQSFSELAYRPVFHDLLDSPEGYVTGAEINALEASLRWTPDIEKLQLQSFRFFNIVSLLPISEWYRPLSWQLEMKLDTTSFSVNDTGLAFITRSGAGYSWGANDTRIYTMAILEADIADEYAQGYSLLAGVQLGVSIQLESSRILLKFETDDAISGAETKRHSIELGYQYTLSSSTALRLNYQERRYGGFREVESVFSLLNYF